jgi:hypothetical protein
MLPLRQHHPTGPPNHGVNLTPEFQGPFVLILNKASIEAHVRLPDPKNTLSRAFLDGPAEETATVSIGPGNASPPAPPNHGVKRDA